MNLSRSLLSILFAASTAACISAPPDTDSASELIAAPGLDIDAGVETAIDAAVAPVDLDASVEPVDGDGDGEIPSEGGPPPSDDGVPPGDSAPPGDGGPPADGPPDETVIVIDVPPIDDGVPPDFCKPCTFDDPSCAYDIHITEFAPLGTSPGFTYTYHLGGQPPRTEYRIVGFNGLEPILQPYTISGDPAAYAANNVLSKWNGYDKWNDPFLFRDVEPSLSVFQPPSGPDPFFEDPTTPRCGDVHFTAHVPVSRAGGYSMPVEVPYECNCQDVAEATAWQVARDWNWPVAVVSVTYNGNGPNSSFVGMPEKGKKSVEVKAEKELGGKGGFLKTAEVKNETAKKMLDVAEANRKRAVENGAKRHAMKGATRFEADIVGGGGPEASLAAARIQAKAEGVDVHLVARDGGFMEENPLYQTTQQKIPTKQFVPDAYPDAKHDIHDFKEAAEASKPVYGYHVALWANGLRSHVTETRAEFQLKTTSTGVPYLEYSVRDKDGANAKTVQDASKGRVLLFLGSGKQRSAPATSYQQTKVPVKGTDSVEYFKVQNKDGVEVDLTTTELARVELERRNVPVAEGVLPLPTTPHNLGDPAYSLQGRFKDKKILLIGDGLAAVQAMDKLLAPGVGIGEVHWVYRGLNTVRGAPDATSTGRDYLIALAGDAARSGSWGNFTQELVADGNKLSVEVTFEHNTTKHRYDTILHATGQESELPLTALPKPVLQDLRLAVNGSGRVVGLVTASGKAAFGGIAVDRLIGELRRAASATTPDVSRLPFQDAARTLKMCAAYEANREMQLEADRKELATTYGFTADAATQHITEGNLYTWSKNTVDLADGNYTAKETP